MKLDLIYYRNILDVALKNFFDEYGGMFHKDKFDDYVFSAGYSQAKIQSIWRSFVSNAFGIVVKTAEIDENDIIVAIDECYPKNNILLKYKDSRYFPKKLDECIKLEPNIKWRLNEKDIKIDISLMNSISIDFFNDCMSRKAKMLNDANNKVVFASHRNLDCYMVFKTVKWLYGKSNCRNLWADCSIQDCCLMSMNENISRYIPEKQKLNKDQEFKKCAQEIKTYFSFEM